MHRLFRFRVSDVVIYRRPSGGAARSAIIMLAARFVRSCTIAGWTIGASAVAVAIAGGIELQDDGMVN